MKYFKSRGLASPRLEIAICSVRVHRNSPCAPRTSKYMRYVEQTSENNTREFHLVAQHETKRLIRRWPEPREREINLSLSLSLSL